MPNTDPEFKQTSQFLLNFQQQQNLRKLQQQQQHQIHQQSQNFPNGNGINGAQHAQQNKQTTQPPSSAALGASALPSNPASAAQPNTASPSTAIPTPQFSPQQLSLLRQQISAFKLLGKNAGVPYQIQQALHAQRQRRQAIAEQSMHASAAGSATPAFEGRLCCSRGLC